MAVACGDVYVYDGSVFLGLAPAAVRVVRLVRERVARVEPLALSRRTLESLPGVAVLEYTLDLEPRATRRARRLRRRELPVLRVQHETRAGRREPVLVRALDAHQLVYRRHEPTASWRAVHDCFL